MNAKARKFLVRELNTLVSRLSGARLRYKYDEPTETHVVEVSPKYVYNSDRFMELSGEVYDKFDNLFPNEGFAFISDDNYLGIDSVEAEERVFYNVSQAEQKSTLLHRKTKAQKIAWA
ncbi:MAG: hypothetical protein LBH84_03685 [Prevotellaceae bacterium]|nr:hypothetical protein [Prevotellaceae bacterium]